MSSEDSTQYLLASGVDYQIRVRGRTDDRAWDFTCDLVERSPQYVLLRTRSDPPHEIGLRPRHLGVKIGDKQIGDATICSLALDGDYGALADYCEYPKGILVIPYHYSPTYQASKDEQEQLVADIEAIRQALKG